MEINIQGKRYRHADILHIDIVESDDSLFGKTMRFCQEWLRGKERFSITTSGTTGKPKPITLHRRQMVASARMTVQALGLKAGDRALVCLNTGFIGGMMMLVRGMEAELIMTIVSPSSDPFETLLQPDFDFTAVVPLQLQTIFDVKKHEALQPMKALLVGGAPVSAALQQQIQTIKAPVYHTYGMTETVSHIALRQLNGAKATEEFHALEGITLGLNERNCLTIRGEVTGNQTITTNDRVQLLTAHSFTWLGRIDLVINSGGIKIQVDQLEEAVSAVFARHLINNRFFIAGLPDPLLGEKVVCVIEGQPFGPFKEKLIKGDLYQALGKYEQVKTFKYVAAFEFSETGKLLRKQTMTKKL